MLQLLNIGVVEGELRKICGVAGGSLNFLDGEVAWNLAKRVDIGSKLKICSGVDFTNTEPNTKDLVGAAGVEDLCDRFSGADIFELVVG